VRIAGPLMAVYQAVGKVFGGLTEVGDAIDAIWRALPPECRRPRADSKGMRRWQWQLQDLGRCWKHVDIEKAVWNLIANQIEDAVIGKTSKALDKRTMAVSRAPVYGLGTRVSGAGGMQGLGLVGRVLG
jgi:hypothetical protein